MPPDRLATRLFQRPGSERDDQSGLLGQRDELHRRNESPLRVLPTDQRLEPEQCAGVERDHRLVVDAHLAPLDGAVERIAGAQVVDRAVMRAGVEQLGPVASEILGAVHRRVSVAQQCLG